MKLVLFILIIDGTSKQHKRMAQKVFNQSLKGLGRFLSILCVRSIRDFDEILVNAYYEPLSRFMILISGYTNGIPAFIKGTTT